MNVLFNLVTLNVGVLLNVCSLTISQVEDVAVNQSLYPSQICNPDDHSAGISPKLN